MSIIPRKCATEVQWAEVAGKVLRLASCAGVCTGTAFYVPVQASTDRNDPQVLIVSFGGPMPKSEMIPWNTLYKWINTGVVVITDEVFSLSCGA